MLKKIICAAAAVVLSVSLTACGATSAADAHQIFTGAVETVNSTAGLDLTINSSISIIANGQSTSMAYSATHTRQTTDGTPQSDTVIMVSAEEESQKTEYIIDGDQGYVMYNDDTSTMNKIASSELEPYMSFTKLFASFEKGAIRKVETEKTDGKTTYDITLKERKSVDLAKDYIAAYMMTSADQINAEVSKAKVTVATDDAGQPVSFRVTLNADAWQGDTTDSKLSCILFATYLINDLGEGVSVTLPDTSMATEHDSSSGS